MLRNRQSVFSGGERRRQTVKHGGIEDLSCCPDETADITAYGDMRSYTYYTFRLFYHVSPSARSSVKDLASAGCADGGSDDPLVTSAAPASDQVPTWLPSTWLPTSVPRNALDGLGGLGPYSIEYKPNCSFNQMSPSNSDWGVAVIWDATDVMVFDALKSVASSAEGSRNGPSPGEIKISPWSNQFLHLQQLFGVHCFADDVQSPDLSDYVAFVHRPLFEVTLVATIHVNVRQVRMEILGGCLRLNQPVWGEDCFVTRRAIIYAVTAPFTIQCFLQLRLQGFPCNKRGATIRTVR
jgi:hypothetical protein